MQEERTARGAGEKLTKLKPQREARQADRSARFDAGGEGAGLPPVGDVREALGESAAGESKQPQADEKLPGRTPPKISDDFTSRLLAARKRARDQMDDKEKK